MKSTEEPRRTWTGEVMTTTSGSTRETPEARPQPAVPRIEESLAHSISRERVYSWEDPAPTLAACVAGDGLSVLQAIAAGRLPLPPAVRTLGIEPVDAEAGKVTFRTELGEHHLNPFGIVHGGVLAAIMDTAMGCAVHSLLPAAVVYVTLELNVRYLRPALVSAGPLICTGTVVNAGRSTMVAEAAIVDGRERVIAVGGSTCLVRRPGEPPSDRVA